MARALSLFAGAGAQFFDSNNEILAYGKIYSYQAGTSTPQAMFTAYIGGDEHPNPIILDGTGRIPNGGAIWMTELAPAKFVLTDADDVVIGTFDNINVSPTDFYVDGTLTVDNLNSVLKATNGLVEEATPGTDYARPDTESEWSAPQTGTLNIANDGIFNLDLGNYFKCTTEGATTLTFANLRESLSGAVLLVNTAANVIEVAGDVLTPSGLVDNLSLSGTYMLGYFTDGDMVYLTGSTALE